MDPRLNIFIILIEYTAQRNTTLKPPYSSQSKPCCNDSGVLSLHQDNHTTLRWLTCHNPVPRGRKKPIRKSESHSVWKLKNKMENPLVFGINTRHKARVNQYRDIYIENRKTNYTFIYIYPSNIALFPCFPHLITRRVEKIRDARRVSSQCNSRLGLLHLLNKNCGCFRDLFVKKNVLFCNNFQKALWFCKHKWSHFAK